MLVSTNNLEFSKFNTGWNGTSHFFSITNRYTSHEVYDLSSLSDIRNATLLIIAPKNPFSAEQSINYQEFLNAGNTIILADDFGTGNSLLKGIGSHISIIKGILTSADRAYNDPYMVITYPITKNHTLLDGIDSLTLDKAATLLYGEPMVSSSLFSWIDKDEDQEITKREILGKYTVVSYEKIGNGEIIVISDPSIFINSMTEPSSQGNNNKFIANMLMLNPSLYIDQTNSKIYDADGITRIMDFIRTFPELQIIITGLFLIVLSIWLVRIKKPPEKKF